MDKIKIVHIIGQLQVGGAEKLLYDLCRKIDKERFIVQVITTHGGGVFQKKFEQAGIPVINFEKSGKWDFSVIDKMADYLRGERPDVVHTHLFAGDFWGGMAARRAGVRNIISTRHDILKEDWLRNLIGKSARRKCSKVVAISRFIFDHLVKKERVSPARIETIYNGIDMSGFYDPRRDIFKKDEVVIGTVGRLSKEKGQKHLLRASCFLKSRNWRMVLAGDGPYRPLLEELTRQLGMEKRVRFLGEISDVASVLREIDIFVLPSVSEGLSLALLEAAASGCFVIATDVGGVPEVVSDGVNGKLFKPKRIEQLVSHLNWAMANTEQARRMARRLQEDVAARFDLNLMVDKYERMYENIANQ
jgi:glycosyltransferase involved in cell wall biosynthesis